jgi:hypothetical protein
MVRRVHQLHPSKSCALRVARFHAWLASSASALHAKRAPERVLRRLVCVRVSHATFARPGIYIMNLGKTWDKLMLAARVIVAIENPADIVCMSARPYGQRAVFKFAQYTGAKSIAGRHTPGTFTNQIQTYFDEPRLLLLTDPRTDHQVRQPCAPLRLSIQQPCTKVPAFPPWPCKPFSHRNPCVRCVSSRSRSLSPRT